MKRNFKRLNCTKKKSGFALPVVLVILAILSIIGVGLVSRFSKTGKNEFLQAKGMNVDYANAYAGIERAHHYLLRPDNPALAHKWSANGTDSFTMNIDGNVVTVTVEDGEWN